MIEAEYIRCARCNERMELAGFDCVIVMVGMSELVAKVIAFHDACFDQLDTAYVPPRADGKTLLESFDDGEL